MNRVRQSERALNMARLSMAITIIDNKYEITETRLACDMSSKAIGKLVLSFFFSCNPHASSSSSLSFVMSPSDC